MAKGSGKTFDKAEKAVFLRKLSRLPQVEKLCSNDAYINRHQQQLTPKSHMIYFITFCRPPNRTVDVVYDMVKGIKVLCVWVFEVVIIMCGLNRFPLRVMKKDPQTKNPFFLQF